VVIVRLDKEDETKQEERKIPSPFFLCWFLEAEAKEQVANHLTMETCLTAVRE
jgi:hypothetical protein